MKYFRVSNKTYKGNIPEIGIDILTFCNNRCSYCYNRSYLSSPKFMSEKILCSIMSKIIEYRKPVKVVLLGGEPTFHPRLKEIVSRFSEIKNVQSLEVYTNGRKNIMKTKVLDALPRDKGIISFTVHPEYVKYIDVIIKNISKVIENGVNYRVYIMFHPSFREKILVIEKKLRENNIQYHLNYIYNYKEDEGIYTLNSPKVYSLSGVPYSIEEIMNNNLNKFKGWNCILDDVGIDINGQVSYSCDTIGSVSVLDKNFKFEKLIVKCPYDECPDECKLSQQKYIEEI